MANEKIMNSRQQQKHDLEINWLKAKNFIPKEGEIIIYDAEEEGNIEHLPYELAPDENGDEYREFIREYWITYPRIKVGDGKQTVEQLSFVKVSTETIGVGKAVNDNAEIFNDYENNEAFGDYSHTEGQNNLSGIKGYRILDFHIGEEGDWIKLDTESTGSFYEIEDCITIMSDNAKYPNCCIITGNETFTFNSPTDYWHLRVSSFPFETFDLSKNFYLYVQTKPDAGEVFFGAGAHAEGINTRAFEIGSHAEGVDTLAAGQYAHAEGDSTQAIGHNSHAEGYITLSAGNYSHSEGMSAKAIGTASHAEGRVNQALSRYSHVEGYANIAEGEAAHAEGRGNEATGDYSHAEGYDNLAEGKHAHAEGSYTKALHLNSHAEGWHTTTTNNYQHVSGKYNWERNPEGVEYLTIVGNGTGDGSMRSNAYTLDTNGNATFAGKIMQNNGEEVGSKAAVDTLTQKVEYIEKNYVTSETTENINNRVTTVNNNLTEEIEKTNENIEQNYVTKTSLDSFYVRGGLKSGTTRGNRATAEGNGVTATGTYAHAEGSGTTASAQTAHAEGNGTFATDTAAHAEGNSTTASGKYSHAEGNQSEASGEVSHAEGIQTTAKCKGQHVQGRKNIIDETATVENPYGTYAHIIGNGGIFGNKNRSNAHTIDWSGNGWFAGNVKVGGTGQDDANAKTLATQEYVNNKISEIDLSSLDVVSNSDFNDAVGSLDEQLQEANSQITQIWDAVSTTETRLDSLPWGLLDNISTAIVNSGSGIVSGPSDDYPYYCNKRTDGRADIYTSTVINIAMPSNDNYMVGTTIYLPFEIYQYAINVSNESGEAEYIQPFIQATIYDTLNSDGEVSYATISPFEFIFSHSNSAQLEEGICFNMLSLKFRIKDGGDLGSFRCDIHINGLWDYYYQG